MSDRISIPALREQVAESLDDEFCVVVKRDVLALVEAVEAAREPLEEYVAIIEGRHPTARLVAPHGLSSASGRKALDALAPFYFGEPFEPPSEDMGDA